MRTRDQFAFVALSIFFLAGLLTGCSLDQPGVSSSQTQYGPPQTPPADAPTLDYEQMFGVDPMSQNAMEAKEKINDLEFRVQQLEKQVRQLNQIVRGIPAIRIGSENLEGENDATVDDEQPTPVSVLGNPGCDCNPCTCVECFCTRKTERLASHQNASGGNDGTGAIESVPGEAQGCCKELCGNPGPSLLVSIDGHRIKACCSGKESD